MNRNLDFERQERGRRRRKKEEQEDLPHSYSHCHRSLPQIYRSQETEKHGQYQERILNVDRRTFTPLVFSALGGASPAASTFLKRLADKVAPKRSTMYAEALGWLSAACHLPFSDQASSVCMELDLSGNRMLHPSDATLTLPWSRHR